MLNADQIAAKATQLADQYTKDGFHWHDLLKIVPAAMEIAEEVEGLDGPGKKALVVDLFDQTLDRLSIPAAMVTKPLLKSVVPVVIDMIASAAGGEVAVNN